jgi:hypothetical protein
VASYVVATLLDLGSDLSLAPERQRASSLAAGGVPLGELVTERNERVLGAELARAVVLDTSHAKDGVVDLASARRASSPPRSAKKRAHAGDVLVSRLRPYLRQIAFVHPDVIEACGGAPLACSTEFYVLAPKREGETIEFLLPLLLGAATQTMLAAGQEGGHHPRVPRATLFGIRVPQASVKRRAETNAVLARAFGEMYRALGRVRAILEPS